MEAMLLEIILVQITFVNMASKLILLANPDVLFSTDSIEKLRNEYISVQKKDKQVKIIGVQLVYLDDPEKIQAIGGSFNKLWGFVSMLGDSRTLVI